MKILAYFIKCFNNKLILEMIISYLKYLCRLYPLLLFLTIFILPIINPYQIISSKNITFKTSLYHNILELHIKKNKERKEISYLANNPLNVGIGISSSYLPFEIFISHSINNKLNPDYQETKSHDLQIHRYEATYVVDFNFQKYQGFYSQEGDRYLDNYPTFSIMTIGLTGQYILNGEKFSYKATFNQQEKPNQSAGSFLLGGGVYFLKLKLPQDLILHNQFRKKSYQIGLNFGYAYNWVYSSNWLLSGSLAVGANLEETSLDSKIFDQSISIKPSSLARLSAFYSTDSWSLGVLGIINLTSLLYSENSQINLHYGRVSLDFMKKIDI